MSLPRVLMLGHCHGVFVQPLCVALKQRLTLDISVLELLSAGAELRGGGPPASAFLSPPQVPELSSNERWSLTRTFFQDRAADWWVQNLASLLLHPSPNRIRTKIGTKVRRLKHENVWKNFLAGYDLYHLHYLGPTFREYVDFLPPSSPLLVSIWGSDLMRSGGLSDYANQLAICHRASLITLRSLDMRELFLAKYGREFESKLRMAKIGDGSVSSLDPILARGRSDSFRSKYNLPLNKILVCIGHNGFEANQQLEVIRALGLLDAKLKATTAFVAPFGYGGNSNYKSRLLAAAQTSGINLTILDKFLDFDEVGQLRLESDVLIHVPISDALSGTMCATLYAGNPVITGAWLPYGELRRRHIYLNEVREIPEIPAMLASVLNDLDGQRKKIANAREGILEITSWPKVIDGWLKVYEELLGRN